MDLLTLGLFSLCSTPAWAQDAPKNDDSAKEAPKGEAPEGEAPPEGEGQVETPAKPAGPSAAEQALRKEMEELAKKLAAQQAQLEAHEAALENQQQELTKTKLKLIPKDEYTVSLEGYYRARGHVFNNMFQRQYSPGLGRAERRDARYMDHRLRIRPTFNYKDLAKMMLQVNGLNNVVWGDNADISSTALFASDPSNTNVAGQTVPSFSLDRAWTEFSVPVGSIRVGRMPSHWGMGLLANDGDWFKGDKWSPLPNTSRNIFGEAHGGNTFDRAIFATKPLAVVDAIAKTGGGDIPFFFVVGIDRLVEEPLTQYYGYQCPSIGTSWDPTDPTDNTDPRCDRDRDGLTDVDRSYTDDTRTPDARADDLNWWADQNDDVWEMIWVFVYRGEDIRYLGGVGDLTAGAYFITRKQEETKSDVVISDAWFRSHIHDVLVEFEGVTISGDTRGIVLQGATGKDPLAKTAGIAGYAGRVGYAPGRFKFQVEHGFATGDDIIADKEFTGRALHADKNVGLLLFEEVLSRMSAATLTSSAQGLWTKGGVYNARYTFPTVHFFPLDNWELIGGFVTATPHRPDGAIIGCNDNDYGDCAQPYGKGSASDPLGWEADFGVHHTWHKHLLFAMEGAYAEVNTDRLDVARAGLNPQGKYFTFQSRIAWQF